MLVLLRRNTNIILIITLKKVLDYCALHCSNYKLYCHPVTRVLLLNDDRYKHLEPHIVSLDTKEAHILSKTTSLEHDGGRTEDGLSSLQEAVVTVSLINAGHCPGSVM